jgi:hypothetical protein
VRAEDEIADAAARAADALDGEWPEDDPIEEQPEPVDEVVDTSCGGIIDVFTDHGTVLYPDEAPLSGGAGSSSDAAPRSPPPLPPPVDAPRAPPRGRGATTYYVPGFPGAKIAYYEDSQIFEATCGNKAKHGRCRKTKTRIGGIGEEMIFKPQKGRPCGFLLAWIQHGSACTVRTDHLCFETSWQQRKDARASLKACAAGRALLECERPNAAHDMLSEMEEPP